MEISSGHSRAVKSIGFFVERNMREVVFAEKQKNTVEL